jgi:hypothetical protein
MCPDFPKPAGGGATAAEVWAYATRELSGFTGTPRTNLLGEDETFEAGVGARKAKIDNIDAAVSSRATQAQILSDATPFPGASIDAAISSRSSHNAAAVWAVAERTITALTGQPRTDIIGENASFELATGRPAKIARLDNIPAFETPVEASIVMDGTEKILVEKTDNKVGLLDGYVDLTPMAGGDTIVIREFMQIKAAGAYAKYAEETYTGAQTIPLLHIVTKTAKDKIKVTAQQTAGTNRTLDVQFYRRLQA